MKTKTLSLALLIMVSLFTVSCKKDTKDAKTEAEKTVAVANNTASKFVADAALSIVKWTGNKPTGSHHGTINISNGVFRTEGNVIKSGTFLIDMKSIKNTDLEGKKKKNLEAHLMGTIEGKTDHFFNVAAHPTAAFEVTGSKVVDGKTMLSGNLNLKGIKHNVTFPVVVTESNGVLTVDSEPFSIDRTKWNVNYGSKSIFDDLGDSFINDDIVLEILIKANKS